MQKSLRSKSKKSPVPTPPSTPPGPVPLALGSVQQIIDLYLSGPGLEHIDPGGDLDMRPAMKGELYDAVAMWLAEINLLRRNEPDDGDTRHIASAAEHLLELAVSRYPSRHFRDPDQREEWATAVGAIRIAQTMAIDIEHSGVCRGRYASTGAFYGMLVAWQEGDRGGPVWFAARVGLVLIDIADRRTTREVTWRNIAALAEATLAGLGVPVVDARAVELNVAVDGASRAAS